MDNILGVWNKHLNTGLLGVLLILVAYWSVSCFLLSSKGKIWASIWRLVSGEVLKAPMASRRPWFCMGFNIFRYEGLADPYTWHA